MGIVVMGWWLRLKKKNSMIVNFANSHMAFKIIYAIILT